ncbi:MAG TPA: hypothetical protein VJ983_05365 [candidate division Zixibacteria bacterium]|nr:hypothetical protein [candidate division Zixibacteria bacterium]
MSIRKSLVFTFLAVFTAVGGWLGCSNDSIVTYVDGNQTINPSADASLYFPADEGYVTQYSIKNVDGTTDQITFTMGKSADIKGQPARVWVASKDHLTDSSFICITSDAVYFYDNISSTGEKVLQLPLRVGSYWSRYPESGTYTYGDDYTDIITGKEDSTGGSGAKKLYPTEGSSTMVVERIEAIKLDNGAYYSNAVRISNEGVESGTKNYYWFVPKIGLVKYVLGTVEGGYSTGEVVGQLQQYYTK